MKGNITLKIKNLILLLILVSFAPFANAQLQTGDIAFVGINSDTNPNEIAILTLSSIASGQTILLTDYAWNGSSLETGNSIAEGFITWTTNTIVPAGTLIKITIGSGAVIGGGLSDFGSVSATGWSADAIASGGDNWFVLQGSIAAPTFIYAYANWSTATYGIKTWPSTGVTFPNATISYLPSSLSNGTTANIQSGSTLYHFDNNVYTGIKSGTKATILLAIADSANWSGSEVDTETKDLTPGGTNFSGVNPIFTVGSPVSISGQPSNISTCTNTNASFSIVASNATGYQWQVNEGSGFTNIANGAPYSGATTTTLTITAATAGMSGYLYRCVVTGADSATSNSGTLTVSNTIVTTNSQTNVSCKGGSNGSAILSASGGISPYTYSWSPSGGTAATASGLTAQTYTVTVTDNIGCVKTHTVIITEPAATLVATAAAQTNVSCFGGSNGTATASASGGTGTYTYLWSNGATTATATGLTASVTPYVCTITDAKGCTTTASTTITQPAFALTASAIQSNVSCTGGSNGSATVTASGGTGSYTYFWSPTGGTAATASGLTASATPYVCTITDANGCFTTVSVTITQPATALAATATQSNVSCNGGSNGTITVSASGGTGTYTYLWSNGATTATASGLIASATPYVCTITDTNGCTTTASVIITQPTVLTATASHTNVSCNGGTNGTATVTALGGTGTYSYLWSNGATAATASGLTASATPYVCTITDANGCTTTISVTITQPTVLTATASHTNVSCNGGSNGTATASASGGTGTYTYLWSNGATTATASGLIASATPYVCTITDANGCTTTASVTITQPASSLVATASQTNVSCNGESNGTATASATGGTGTYSYFWSTGASGVTASGLTASATPYVCLITDANGCTTTVSVTIIQPAIALAATATQSNVSCNGGSNGSATVSASGGTGTYTYLWSNGATTATASGLTASATPYVCTITDANRCTTTASVIIAEPTAITATATQSNVSCNGGTNGTATVTALGGTGTYSYLWSNGATAATATGLTASATPYVCRVTDANGCTATVSLTITQPAAALTATATQSNVSCNGGSNGSATVSASGGTGSYTYFWSPTGGTAATATGLTASATPYVCTITDTNGCFTTVSVTITQPATALAATATQSNVSCNGGSNGSATVSASGGTGSYTYSWLPSGGTAATASGLAASATPYVCTITDANGCSTTVSVTITQPAAALAATATQSNVSCNGGSNGSITVSASGGTGTHTYLWSNRATTATASGLTASATPYVCTITDANGCTTTASVIITQPAAITATATQSNVSCNGGTNGTATVTALGGTGTYSYLWTNGATTATASGLTASATPYVCTITDANGCTTIASVIITQPAAITATATQSNVSCNGGSNGSATVTASGGTGSYTYLWSPSGGTAATASGLTASATPYVCTITDTNGCSTTVSVTITQPATALAATATQSNVSCNGGTNGTATVSASGGTGTYSYLWSNGDTGATATGLTASATPYVCTITDANGCSTTASVTITQPTALRFSTTALLGYDYNISYNQNIVATAGTGELTYAITSGSLPTGFTLSSNGQITGVSSQVTASDFIVTVTDANSCTASYNFVLTVNQIPITVTATASQTKVYGQNDPVYTYTVTPDLLSGDSFTGSLTRASGENIGNYVINSGTLSAGSKYLMTFVSNDFEITAKPITVTADALQMRVYGAVDPVFTYSVSPSLVGSDTFTGALTRVAGEDVQTYAIEQGNLSAGSNYEITYAGKDFEITAKPITVTATASQTKVYGTADSALTYSVSPLLVGSDSFTGSLTRIAGESVRSYTIEQGSLSAGSNYTVTYVGDDFAITAKPITVTADASQSKVYGTADPVFTYSTLPTLVGSDSFTGSLSRATGEGTGTYVIALGNLSAGSNYAITYVSKNFEITAKPITVTVDASQTKVYGTAEPVFTYTVLPRLVGSDSFTGSLTRGAGENVGTYPIAQGSLSAGTNYTISYVGADFSITKADQLITWNQTLALGCDGDTTAVLTATSSSGLPVSYTSSNSAVATLSNGLLVTNNYGYATITGSQMGNTNYNAAPIVTLALSNSQPNLIRKQFEDIIFFDNSSNSFKSYSWYKNGVLVPGQTSQYYKENGGPLNGTYYAVATKLDGTLVNSCPLTLSPTVEEEYIKIVPNPVKPDASYELLTNVTASRLQNARIEVYSIAGLLIESKTITQNPVTLKAPTVEGIYIVKMTLANGKCFTKNLLIKN